MPIFVGVGFIIQLTMNSNDAKQNLTYCLLALVIAAVASNMSSGLALYLGAATWINILFIKLQKALKL